MSQPPPDGSPPDPAEPPRYEPPRYEPPRYEPPRYEPPPLAGEWSAPPPAQPGDWSAPQAPEPQWLAPRPVPPGSAGYAGAADGTQWDELSWAAPTPFQPRRRGRRRLIAAVAVVALAGGAAVSYVAVSDASSHGASSPISAVQTIVSDINGSDLAGLLDDLAPAERDAIATPLLNDIGELKRINVLQPNADPKNVTAVKTSIKALVFAPTVPVNDHEQIVQLTGGTVTIAGDASKIPFTKDFVNALFPHGLPTGTSSTSTVDIAQAVQANGGEPIRVAAEKVGGRWYPSLFYTIADNAAHSSGLGTPTAGDYVAANGAASAGDAVKQIINALLQGNIARAIQLLSPEELAVVHDYAGLIMRAPGSSYSPSSVHLDSLQVSATPISGGAQRIAITGLTMTNGHGSTVRIVLSGGCISTTVSGQPTNRQCSAQIIESLANVLAPLGGGPLTSAQQRALTHLLGDGTGTGIIATQSGGQWFINPVRTIFEASTSVLGRLQGTDVADLISIIKNFGH